MRADAKKRLQITDLIDANLLACGPAFPGIAPLSARAAGLGRQGIRLEEPKVGVVALLEPRTRGTGPACGIRAVRRLAQEPFCEATRQMRLTKSRTAMEQERMRQLLAAFDQAQPRL